MNALTESQLAGETPALPETGKMPVLLLSVTERAVLLECEDVVRKGLKSFVQVGNALARIRDSRLYREMFRTFEEYCLAVWDISDRHARNLWSAADVYGELAAKQFSVLPETESQARPLTKLPRVEWAPAWEEVVGTAPAGRVTGSHVAAVAQRRLDRLKPAAVEKAPSHSAQPKVIDAGTREERIIAAQASALAQLRELQDLIPAGDGGAAHVATAINCVDSFQVHFHTVRRLKGHVEKSQGLNQELAKRAVEQKQTEGAK